MAHPFLSIDQTMANEATYGDYPFIFPCRISGAQTPVANATSGYQSGSFVPQVFTIPSLGASCPGCYVKYCRPIGVPLGSNIPVYHTVGGTLTFGGGAGTFTAGTGLGTKRWAGKATAAQVASTMPLLYVSTVLAGATTPTITVGYTNQAGTSGRSMTMTLPSNPAAQATYQMAPHLQSGDLGIQSIQSMSTSGGTSGVLKVALAIPLAQSFPSSDAMSGHIEGAMPTKHLMLEAGDLVGFYRFNQTASAATAIMLVLGVESP